MKRTIVAYYLRIRMRRWPGNIRDMRRARCYMQRTRLAM